MKAVQGVGLLSLPVLGGGHAILFGFHDAVAGTRAFLHLRAVQHRDATLPYVRRPPACNWFAAVVTPRRRTPSMLATRPSVIRMTLDGKRSRLNRSQRHSC